MKKFRNILAMLMVFVMLVAVMPMNVFAEETDPAPTEPTTFKVTFNVGEHGTAPAEQNVAKDGKVTKPENPTAEGFKFEGWFEDDKLTKAYDFETAVTKAITLYAKWTEEKPETFKVTFNVGEHGKAPAEQNVAKDGKVTKPENPTAEGFKFEGWFEDDKLTKAYDFETAVTKAITLYAKWTEEKPETFKVTFNVGEHGKAPAEQNVAKDGKVTKPENPTAEGFKFEGWFEDDKLTKPYDFKTAVTKAITLYAKWSKVTPQPKPETKEYTISKAYTNHGSFTVSESKAKAGETITVTATPNYGYAVKNVYYKKADGTRVNIKNYAYNDYYYYAYNDRYYDGYYGDYYRYYSDYENNYYHDYSSYDAYLKDRHYSFWNNGYRYWDDYDYKYYNRYYDRYNDRYYDAYDSDYYRYYYDYVDNYYRRYSSYEDYLYDKHYSHYRDYRYYDKYDYRYYNYTTTDTFTMPASNITVYVEFTDWSYYGYYYDDYYYYRYHRDKKNKVKEEKEEEEKKPVEEKTPQVFEASATINVGSNVFTKVNKNVTTTHQMDVAAYVKNGRVMLPLRYVAEALGLQVSWVPQTKTVIIWDLTQKVEIPIKSNKMIVNGVTYTSDVKPEIKNSRTMLPIANIARALGLVDGSDIIWDPVMKQVKLTRRVLSK